MLRAEKLDIAILCPENARHAEVAEAAAQHGVHMVTEKPMAASLEDALRMKSAAETAGVALAVNWPITWSPAIRRLKELLDAGAIGDVWELKWRNGASLGPLAHGSVHPGATVVSGEVTDAEKGMEWWHQTEAGGGAMLDYCCYGACLASWLLPAPPRHGSVPRGEPDERLRQRRRQRGDAAALPDGDRDSGGELDHFPSAGSPTGRSSMGRRGRSSSTERISWSIATAARRRRAWSRRASPCRRAAPRSGRNSCIISRPAIPCIRRSPIRSTSRRWRSSTRG